MTKGIDKEMFNSIVNENLDLKKQITQLEGKGKTVSKLKYDKLNEAFEALRAKCIDTEKYLNTIKVDYLQLADEHKKIMSGTDAVSKSEYNNLVKAIETAEAKAKRWEQLFEKEKQKRNKLIEQYQNKIDTPALDEYKKLEKEHFILKAEHEGLTTRFRGEINLRNEYKKLYEECQDKTKSGRKRKNDILDRDIITMKEGGKSLRTIAKETKLSVNTIRAILKNVSK